MHEPARHLPDHLAAPAHLPGFQWPANVPDPGGFTVRSPQGQPLGRVKTVLVNPTTGEPFFAVIASRRNQRFAVPWAILEIDPDRREVRGPFTPADFRRAPDGPAPARTLAECARRWGAG